MYSSLSSMDLVAEIDGRKVAIQTDHRGAGEIDADWDVSVVFAAARARNPLRTGQAAGVRFAQMEAPSPAYARFVAQLGAELEAGIGTEPTPPARDDAAADAAVDAALDRIGRATLAAGGYAEDLAGLEALEPVMRRRVTSAEEDDQDAFWRGVVELAAATIVVMRKSYTVKLHRDAELASMIPYRVDVNGTLLNVFGRTERFFGEDGSELPSRLLGMLADNAAPDGDVMFHLRPTDWPGKGMALTLPFLAKMDNMPVLALAIDLPTSVKSIPTTEDAAEIARFEALARANIAKLNVQIDEVAGGEMRAIVASGSYYAAEKLFDRAFLVAMAEKLGAGILLAGIPSKGRLWLHDGMRAPEIIATFTGIVAKEYDRASPQDRITKEVFLVQNGEVVGLSRLTGGAAPEPEPPKKGFWARLFGR